MVMDFGMSRLGQVNYPREPAVGLSGRRARTFPANAATASRRAGRSTRRSPASSSESLEKVRGILQTRRKALVALAERLIEKEVIDTEELKQIIEANSPSAVIVPGTADAAARRVPDEHAAATETKAAGGG